MPFLEARKMPLLLTINQDQSDNFLQKCFGLGIESRKHLSCQFSGYIVPTVFRYTASFFFFFFFSMKINRRVVIKKMALLPRDQVALGICSLVIHLDITKEIDMRIRWGHPCRFWMMGEKLLASSESFYKIHFYKIYFGMFHLKTVILTLLKCLSIKLST